MKYFLLLLLFFISIKANPIRLHVATRPSSAEISLDQPHNPHTPPQISPIIFHLNSPDSIIDIFLLKPGYISRHVKVRIKNEKLDNYAHFFLTQETDSLFLMDQIDFLNHRKRIQFGKILGWSSLLPFLSAMGFAGVAQWEYSKAEFLAEKTNSALLQEDPQFASDKKQMDQHIQKGDQMRTFAIGSAVTTVILSSIGLILRF